MRVKIGLVRYEERFRIDELAGSGGMGAVYRAWDHLTGSVVALKVLHSHRTAAPVQSQTATAAPAGSDRFAREAQLLSELNHPGIVSYVDDGQTGSGEPYLAMEWLEGETLGQRLKRSLLSYDEAIAVAKQLASVLAAAHERGIVHRDIKPDNIFFVDRSVERLKLLDFGVAHVHAAAQELTATGRTLGTPGFMAPEQLRSSRRAVAGTDLYGVGAVLFKALAGRLVFDGTTALEIMLPVLMEPAPRLSTLLHDVPPGLDQLVATLLAKDPKHRPRDAHDLAWRLGNLGEPTAVTAEPSAAHDTCFLLLRNRGSERLSAARISELRAVGMALGAELEVLVDGSVMVSFPTQQEISPAEKAQWAARTAMSLMQRDSELRVTLATGEHTAPSFGDGIRLDDRAADLLSMSTFPIDRDAHGAFLRSGPAPRAALEPTGAGVVATNVTRSNKRAGAWSAIAALAIAGVAAASFVGYRAYSAADNSETDDAAEHDDVAGGRGKKSTGKRRPTKRTPSSKTETVTPFVCPYERCLPHTVPDRSEITAALPAVKAMAASVDPDAKLVMFHTIPFIDGRLEANDGAASFLFRHGAELNGKTNSFTVIFARDHIMLHRGPEMAVVSPIDEPKCGARAAWQAALDAGLKKGTKISLVFQRHANPAPEWIIQDWGTSLAYYIDGDQCELIRSNHRGPQWGGTP